MNIMYTPYMCLYCSSYHRDLHSFPTRRSSDLIRQKIPLSLSKLCADENRMIQILFILINNALHYLEQGWILIEAEEKDQDRKSTRLNSSHVSISYAVFCLKKKKNIYKEMQQEL